MYQIELHTQWETILACRSRQFFKRMVNRREQRRPPNRCKEKARWDCWAVCPAMYRGGIWMHEVAERGVLDTKERRVARVLVELASTFGASVRADFQLQAPRRRPCLLRQGRRLSLTKGAESILHVATECFNAGRPSPWRSHRAKASAGSGIRQRSPRQTENSRGYRSCWTDCLHAHRSRR
jgi:hypothetical protein